MYRDQFGELFCMWILGLKGLKNIYLNTLHSAGLFIPKTILNKEKLS